MLRNSASLSSKLIHLSSPNFQRFSGIHGIRGGLFEPHIQSSLAGSSALENSSKFGFGRHAGEIALRFSSSAILGSSAPNFASLVGVKDVARAVHHYGQCYWELSKARLSLLVVATSGAGFVIGSGSVVDFAGLCWACGGTMMVAASANSLNQVFEKYNDARMKRTMLRPLPSGRISRPHAAIWASSVGVAGTTLLACQTNMMAAGLAATTLSIYAFMYTPLKQVHHLNTWVGAIVGAIPPLIGWAAATGEISLNGMILPAALYFWQIPHFMALAYLCRNDYAAGGFKMLSLSDVSGRRTALVALRNCFYLLPIGFLAYNWGVTTGWFCLESSLFTLAMTAGAVSFYRNRTAKNARRMFHASLLYLPVFMSGLLFHRVTDDNKQSLVQPNIDKVTEFKNFKERKSKRTRQRSPPVAYASVAPFPFLPVPVYAED